MADAALHPSLVSLPPFSGFSEPELSELLSKVQRRSYRADETIYREGDPPTFIYYIQSGGVSLTLASEERRISVGKFGAGRLIGIQTVFDEGPHFTSATALVPTTVLAIPRSDLVLLLRRHPDAMYAMATIFATQIRAAAQLVAEMQFLDLPVRLAKRILELAEVGGRERAGMPAVKVTQQELSELAGATRGGVNRALKRLEQLGLVRVSRGTVIILSSDRLRQLAQQEPLPMLLGLAQPVRGASSA